jgi:hypothetical protein
MFVPKILLIDPPMYYMLKMSQKIIELSITLRHVYDMFKSRLYILGKITI